MASVSPLSTSPALSSATTIPNPKPVVTHLHDTSDLLDLNPNQLNILEQFRTQLEEEGHLKPNETLGTDDETLIRFLKARKFNLPASKRMITQCLQWRHQVEGIGIDGLYERIDPFDFPNKDQVFQYWPMYFHRIDKIGRPVNIQMFGSLDFTKLYTVIDKQAHFQTLVANCEALTREILPACSYRNYMLKAQSSSDSSQDSQSNSQSSSPESCQGEKITNAFCIVDLKGFTLTQFWHIKNIARICFSISQDYYPETMGYLAIINAPKSFATIFKAITPWLSKETISKINILGEDYHTTLSEYIDDENLPSYLGGKCECNNRFACSKNDESFDRSPWLKDRDWKNQSWKKFEIHPQKQSGNSASSIRNSGLHQQVLGNHGSKDDASPQNNEITDGGITSDGALIINSSPKTRVSDQSTKPKDSDIASS